MPVEEGDWLNGACPQAMLDWLTDTATERKLRLFAVASCRRIWHLLTDERSRNAVEAAEQYAEGEIGPEELNAAAQAAWKAQMLLHDAAFHAALAAYYCADRSSSFGARECVDTIVAATICDPKDPELEEGEQAKLLREIFGNPFREVTINPSCLQLNDATVPKLALAISDNRDFALMPILADALEDAGCHDADILNHCRQPGEHIRGCWVLDLLLARI
jgi:hypothetical protein